MVGALRFSRLGGCLALLLCVPRSAESRSCSQNPNIPPNMLGAVSNMATNPAITWEDNGPNFGIKNLFVDGGCGGYCHFASSTYAYRFVSCANCHSDPGYPDWLRFDSIASLKRTSYYAPHLNKAQASLMRATDGTMPPGAWANDGMSHAGAAVSWCDELVAAMNTWINNGMP